MKNEEYGILFILNCVLLVARDKYFISPLTIQNFTHVNKHVKL